MPTSSAEQDRVPVAVDARTVPPRSRPTNYPAPFAGKVAGRVKRPLGDQFRLRNFGVNLTTLAPGGHSALHHRHSLQDEFVYVLEGEVTLVTDDGATPLRPGMCAGFAAGQGAHHLENRSDADVAFLEVGDRTPGDEGSYPNDDLRAALADGRWRFTHKDGTPY
jgi:uncharacterized cupin superfamily protein